MYEDAYTIWKKSLFEKLHDKIRGEIEIYFTEDAMVVQIHPYNTDIKFVKLYNRMTRRISEGLSTKDTANEITQNYKNFLLNKFFRYNKNKFTNN